MNTTGHTTPLRRGISPVAQRRFGGRRRPARLTDRALVAVAVGFAALTADLARAAERAAQGTMRISRGGEGQGETGPSARELRRRAIADLPLERMPGSHRAEIESFVRSTTIYRRLPEASIACHDDLLAFLLDKPEALVDVWRTLEISRLALDPVAPGAWQLADGYGTTGLVRILHRERDASGGLLVFHGRGAYTGTLCPKRLTGSCLVVIRHRRDGVDLSGTPRHLVSIDAFLDADGLGLELVTRTLQPLIVHSAAANLREVALFVTQFAAAGDRNPAGVARLTERMVRTPAEDRRRLANLAGGGSPGGGSAEGGEADEMFQTELAARWLSTEQLDAVRTR